MISIRLLSLFILLGSFMNGCNAMMTFFRHHCRKQCATMSRNLSYMHNTQDYKYLKRRFATRLIEHRPRMFDFLDECNTLAINPNSIVTDSGITALMKASETADIASVITLLSCMLCNIHAVDQHGNNALAYALNGYVYYIDREKESFAMLEVIKILLEHGSNQSTAVKDVFKLQLDRDPNIINVLLHCLSPSTKETLTERLTRLQE